MSNTPALCGPAAPIRELLRVAGEIQILASRLTLNTEECLDGLTSKQKVEWHNESDERKRKLADELDAARRGALAVSTAPVCTWTEWCERVEALCRVLREAFHFRFGNDLAQWDSELSQVASAVDAVVWPIEAQTASALEELRELSNRANALAQEQRACEEWIEQRRSEAVSLSQACYDAAHFGVGPDESDRFVPGWARALVAAAAAIRDAGLESHLLTLNPGEEPNPLRMAKTALRAALISESAAADAAQRIRDLEDVREKNRVRYYLDVLGENFGRLLWERSLGEARRRFRPELLGYLADTTGIAPVPDAPALDLPEEGQGGEAVVAENEKPDGPFDPDGFRFGGAQVEFGRASFRYRLVLALWDRERVQPCSPRPVEDVICEVYGEDHETSDAAFRQLCTDTRTFLANKAFPLSIRSVNGKVWLVPV